LASAIQVVESGRFIEPVRESLEGVTELDGGLFNGATGIEGRPDQFDFGGDEVFELFGGFEAFDRAGHVLILWEVSREIK
jgi:hypothetical protein